MQAVAAVRAPLHRAVVERVEVELPRQEESAMLPSSIIAISLYRKIARPSKFSCEDPKCSVKRATAQRATLTAPRPLRRGLVPLAHHLAHDLQVGRGGR